MHHSVLLKIFGPLLMIAGFIIRFKISEKRFNRRSITGIEIFPSYKKAVTTQAKEGCAGILAKMLIFIGIVFILAQWV
jgi:hypothetical protein